MTRQYVSTGEERTKPTKPCAMPISQAGCCRACAMDCRLLVAQHRQRAADALAGGVRHDHVVDEATGAGDERVGELFLVLGALGQRRRIVSFPRGR